MATTLLQSCFHNNPSVNLVLTFITVIQCLSIHLHSFAAAPTLILSQLCILPLFFFFFLNSIAHILLFCFSLSFSPPVWVLLCRCYTSSRYLYTRWCHTSRDSLFVCTQLPESMLPRLTLEAGRPVAACCRAAELQVQISLSSPFNKRSFVCSQPWKKKKKNRRGSSELGNIDSNIIFFYLYPFMWTCFSCFDGYLHQNVLINMSRQLTAFLLSLTGCIFKISPILITFSCAMPKIA